MSLHEENEEAYAYAGRMARIETTPNSTVLNTWAGHVLTLASRGTAKTVAGSVLLALAGDERIPLDGFSWANVAYLERGSRLVVALYRDRPAGDLAARPIDELV